MAALIEHQLGQRNFNDDQKYYWIGKHNELQKKLVGRPNGNGIKVTPFQRTREEVAAQHKVSEATVSRATQFTRAMDTIADKIGDEARTEILDGDLKLTRQEVQKLVGRPNGKLCHNKRHEERTTTACAPRMA